MGLNGLQTILRLRRRMAERRLRRAHGWGWLSQFFLGRADLAGMADNFQTEQGQYARLMFAQRQPDWHTLALAVRNRILESYAQE